MARKGKAKDVDSAVMARLFWGRPSLGGVSLETIIMQLKTIFRSPKQEGGKANKEGVGARPGKRDLAWCVG